MSLVLQHCRRQLECAKWPSRLVVTGGTSKDLFGCCYNLQTTQHTAGKDTHWLNVFLQGWTQQVFFWYFFPRKIIRVFFWKIQIGFELKGDFFKNSKFALKISILLLMPDDKAGLQTFFHDLLQFWKILFISLMTLCCLAQDPQHQVLAIFYLHLYHCTILLHQRSVKRFPRDGWSAAKRSTW